jgi:hypothetical protein
VNALAEAEQSGPLRVSHPREPFAVALPTPDAIGSQQELPLQWPADRHGAAAAAHLHRYPDLPLHPGVPRPEPYVAHAAALVADVLAGARPATQLGRTAVLDVQRRLARRSAQRSIGPAWTGRSARISTTSTMVVSGAAAQIAVVFFIGRRAHAAALRMEFRHGRWLVTDVDAAL